MIKSDFEALTKKPWSTRKAFARFISDPGFRAVCLYRWGHSFYRRGARVRARIMQMWMLRSCHCSISVAAEIGPGFCIRHVGGIVIGGRSVMGSNCEIRQGVTLGGNVGRSVDGRTQPVIGDNVRIAAGAKILGPVIVGSRTIIGANAVVLNDVPDDSVAVGVPARVVKVNGRKVGSPGSDGVAQQLNAISQRLEAIEQRLNRLDRDR